MKLDFKKRKEISNKTPESLEERLINSATNIMAKRKKDMNRYKQIAIDSLEGKDFEMAIKATRVCQCVENDMNTIILLMTGLGYQYRYQYGNDEITFVRRSK